MFVKPQKTSGSSLLKNKDVKKFRKDLSIRLGDAASDERLQTVVPNKATVKKQSFQAPSRMVVYVNEDSREPVAFDDTGKGDGLCVSVYALWREPKLLPHLVVHAPVSEFVLRGADVMLPGVVFSSVEELQSLRKGEIRALFARGNPHAFAVGELLVDAEEIQKHGKKGKSLRVLHYYGDELWKMGPQTLPNEGFPTLSIGNEKIVIKVIGDSGAAIDESESDDDDNRDDNGTGLDIGSVELEETKENDLEEKSSTPGYDVGEDPEEETTGLSKEEMDELYHNSFLQALRSGRLKEKQLPMLASTFHGTVLLPCRPAGSTLNIKHTSHKKLSVFLMSMAAKGFIALSEKDGVQSITAVVPRHPEILAHAVYKTADDVKREEEAAAAAAAGGRTVPPPPGTHAPDVQEFIGLSQQLKRLLTEDQELAIHFEDVTRKDSKRYWAAVEVRELINKYIDVASLADIQDKKYVRLNGPLTDAVFSGNKMPPGGYPSSMARPDLYAILTGKCTKYHRIVLYPGHEPKILAGSVRKIEISAEQSKKHRSSTVTTIAYYQPFGIDGAVFAKEAQKKWGCSAVLQPSEDKNKGEEIKVQGQMVNEIMDFLGSKYKIATAKYCNVTYGKNVKPKKK